MSVQFLSDEYMEAATQRMAEHGGFQGAIQGVDLGLQFVVTEAPDGEVKYYLDIADGGSVMALGELDEPDVTVTNGYDTAIGISQGEVNTQMAFMTGKLKVAGNMAKLMMNQNVFNELQQAVKDLDVEY